MYFNVKFELKYVDFDINKYYTVSEPIIGTGIDLKTRSTYV